MGTVRRDPNANIQSETTKGKKIGDGQGHTVRDNIGEGGNIDGRGLKDFQTSVVEDLRNLSGTGAIAVTLSTTVVDNLVE